MGFSENIHGLLIAIPRYFLFVILHPTSNKAKKHCTALKMANEKNHWPHNTTIVWLNFLIKGNILIDTICFYKVLFFELANQRKSKFLNVE